MIFDQGVKESNQVLSMLPGDAPPDWMPRSDTIRGLAERIELDPDALEATVTRFNAGVATNFEVGQANDDLTSARLSELRALMNHINAIAEFERVQVVGN